MNLNIPFELKNGNKITINLTPFVNYLNVLSDKNPEMCAQKVTQISESILKSFQEKEVDCSIEAIKLLLRGVEIAPEHTGSSVS